MPYSYTGRGFSSAAGTAPQRRPASVRPLGAPHDAADGRRGRRVLATVATQAWQLDGRCRGDPHLVYTVRRRVISMTRAPCRCSASPSFTLRPASLLLHSHRRRSWHDSGTPARQETALRAHVGPKHMHTVRVFSAVRSFCYVCAYCVACACPWSI